MNVTAAAVIENLKLANNGYTYEQSVPREYRAKLADLVEAGVVIKRSKRHPARRGMDMNVYIVAENAEAVLESMRNPA